MPPTVAVDDALIDELEHGPLHRFAHYAMLTDVIPGSGAGVYTIWDDAGGLVYTGIAGRNPAGKGLASRLRSHASGRRSGDQFCVYAADHYVLPEPTREQIEAIRDSTLSMDALVREKIHVSFGFRFVVADGLRGGDAGRERDQERAPPGGSPAPQPVAVKRLSAGSCQRPGVRIAARPTHLGRGWVGLLSEGCRAASWGPRRPARE